MTNAGGTPMPRVIEPMTAVAGTLPALAEEDRYGYEVKWDGVRVIAYVPPGGEVRATGRRGAEVTRRYPELGVLRERLGGAAAVLDGEVVAHDSAGRPSFAALQRRMHVEDPARRGLTREVPVHYVAFDLLYLDGMPLYDVPYERRRALLDALDLGGAGSGAGGGAVLAPPYFRGPGVDLLEATRQQGLEGLVAKRLDSPYRPGRRCDYWIKIKNLRAQDVVICGWRPGRGRRALGIGSLLLGVYIGDELHYVGNVGTGFTDHVLDELAATLAALRRDTTPYGGPVPREVARDARWVEPRLVGEVAYTVWTPDGRLRNPSWRGLRPDRAAEEVTRDR